MSEHIFEKHSSQLKMLPKQNSEPIKFNMENSDMDVSAQSVSKRSSISAVFSKGPVLKSLFGIRFANDAEYICNPNAERKACWILAGLILIFLLSFTGVVITWYTDVFNLALFSGLVLSNTSQAFSWWQHPPVKPLFKINIFNYTNVERWQDGWDEKLRVEEIGPYVYRETMERVNEIFHENGTISYQERRQYQFEPEKSIGKHQYDQLTVPNLPFLSAVSIAKDSYYMARLGLNAIFNSVNAGPFTRLPAHKFFWGYDDPLINLARPFLTFQGPLPFEKFGIVAARNGTSKDRMTIFTGANDISRLGTVSRFNGNNEFHHWGTQECNRIDGTDGSVFPPSKVDRHQTLYIFSKDLCRRFPLVYERDVTVMGGVPAWRYHAPSDVFDHPDSNPANQCYCHMDSGICPKAGLFNATPCAFGAPAFVSFPHFYLGDPSLVSAVDGLKPDPKKHETYVDLHPRMGFTLGGVSRFQFNFQVRKSFGITGLDTFDDGMILPVAWMEFTAEEDDLSPEIRTLIYHSTFSANALQLALRYGTVLTCMTSLAILVTSFYLRRSQKKYLQRVHTRSLQRNISGQSQLIE